MLSRGRNKIRIGNWQFKKLDIADYEKCKNFDCDDDDLNDFFRRDALDHKKELLTETYSLSLVRKEQDKDLSSISIALISFCNDAIIFPDEDRKKFLPDKKSHYKSLPSVKIARLGVDCNVQRSKLGTFLVMLSKTLFMKNNRTGCRFITVDAYNKEKTINFYQKNGFRFLHDKDREKRTRIMYFDLKRVAN